MKRLFAWTVLPWLLSIGGTVEPALAYVSSVLGKWLVKAETPNGPLEIAFDLKQEGNQLIGTAAMMQQAFPLSTVKFEDPDLTVEISLGGGKYKMLGKLKDGKFSGSWEEVGGDMKGTWTAERTATATQATTAGAAGVISGTWDVVSATPNGDLALTLDLKQDGDKLDGTIAGPMGTMPIQAASFKENKLQFDIEIAGGVYRLEGLRNNNKIEGKWYPVGGGEGGTWSATRRAAAAAPAAAVPSEAASAIVGTWNSVASSSAGDLPLQVIIKKSGDALSGQIVTQDVSLPLQKLTFLADNLSFEVEYMGAVYRIVATLANGKLTGKWSAVDGSDNGPWTADRKP